MPPACALPLPAQGRRAAAALALCLLAACGGGGGGADPAGHDDTAYDLVFDTLGSDGVARLQRSDVSGTQLRSIGGGVRGMRATASPGGTALLFAAGDPTDPLAPSVLHQLDLASGQVQRLSPDHAAVETEPSVAPDGASVAYTSQRDDSGGDIVVARWDGGALTQPRRLSPAPAPAPDPDRTPAWSPDGRHIAYTAYRDGGPAIWVMAADGTDARRLTTPGNWGDFSPSWSADGRVIAFQRVDDGGADGAIRSRLGFVSASGGPPHFLTLPYSAYDPRYSPDGRWLAFWAKTEDGGDICIASAEGALLRCFGSPGIDRHPAWLLRR